MIKTTFECEVCKKTAIDEEQKRKENWIEVRGGATYGIYVWLEEPRQRKKNVADTFMLHVGFRDRQYHFCSTECLVQALESKESI